MNQSIEEIIEARRQKYKKRYRSYYLTYHCREDIKEKKHLYSQRPDIKEREKRRKQQPEIIEKRKAYFCQRRQQPEFRLVQNLRSRISKALRGKSKAASTLILLGIQNEFDPIEYLWLHLEKSFKPLMTRENYGKWHVDHIRPCSSFDLTDAKQQKICFHYTNLQALWAHENLYKKAKL